MFKFNKRANYEIKFAGKHYEAIRAIMQSLGIKDKSVEAGNNRNSIWKISFKATETELNELFTKLGKYGIGKAFI